MYSRRTIIKNGLGSVLGMVLVSFGFKGQAQADEVVDEKIVFLPDAGPEILIPRQPQAVEKWYGDDGTLFKLEPLSATRDSWDYFLAAYPAWKHYENLETVEDWQRSYRLLPYYQRIEFDGHLVANVGIENIYDMLRQYKIDFETSFYDATKDGYLTSDEPFGTVYSTPRENVPGWGAPNRRPQVMWGSELGGIN